MTIRVWRKLPQRPMAGDGIPHRQHDDGADHRHQGRDDEAVLLIFEIAAEGAEQETAGQGAHQPQCDIDHAAAALLAHDQARQPADEGAEHNPAENLHFSFLTMGGLDPPTQDNELKVRACGPGWPARRPAMESRDYFRFTYSMV